MFSSNNFTNGTLKVIKRDPLTEYRRILISPMPIFGHPVTSGPELPIKLTYIGVHVIECASQITQKKYGIIGDTGNLIYSQVNLGTLASGLILILN